MNWNHLIAHYERVGQGEIALLTGGIKTARYIGPDDISNGIIMQEVMPRAGYVVKEDIYCNANAMFKTTGYSTLVNYGDMQINGFCQDGFAIYVNNVHVDLPVQVNKGDVFKVVTSVPVYPNARIDGGFSYVFNQEEVISHPGQRWWRAAVNLYAIE